MQEHDIRRIVREELALLLGVALQKAKPVKAPREASRPEESSLVRFVSGCQVGERVPALAFYGRWKAWAEREAPETAWMTPARFGRAVTRTRRVRRERTHGGRVYVVLPDAGS